jgi:hypothetical protein
MIQREQRYWHLLAAPSPGDVVAEHDGGVGLDEGNHPSMASGPGNYRVIVRRPGSDLPDAPVRARWPIELHASLDGSSQPLRFNPGMARWFGLRLIEAAALCEAFDVAGGASPSVAPAEIRRLADWMEANAADWIRGSAVDSAIALLSHAKGIVNSPAQGEGDAPPAPPAAKDEAIGYLREFAKKLIDLQSVTAATELRSMLHSYVGRGDVTREDWEEQVVGYFSPNDQTILRGRVNW